MKELIEKFPRFVEYCREPLSLKRPIRMQLVKNLSSGILEYRLPLVDESERDYYFVYGIKMEEGSHSRFVVYVYALYEGYASDTIGDIFPMIDMLEPTSINYSNIFKGLISHLVEIDSYRNLGIYD